LRAFLLAPTHVDAFSYLAALRQVIVVLDPHHHLLARLEECETLRRASPTRHPHVGIAVDVTHATDCPTVDKKQEGDVALGKGPVIYRGPNMNPQVVTRLIDTAKAGEIPFQLAASGRATGTDANAIQISRAGVAAGLVSIPIRYMHSAVEMISLEDVDRAADLLANFAAGLTGNDDFTP
jgi:endoglucanase